MVTAKRNKVSLATHLAMCLAYPRPHTGGGWALAWPVAAASSLVGGLRAGRDPLLYSRWPDRRTEREAMTPFTRVHAAFGLNPNGHTEAICGALVTHAVAVESHRAIPAGVTCERCRKGFHNWKRRHERRRERNAR